MLSKLSLLLEKDFRLKRVKPLLKWRFEVKSGQMQLLIIHFHSEIFSLSKTQKDFVKRKKKCSDLFAISCIYWSFLPSIPLKMTLIEVQGHCSKKHLVPNSWRSVAKSALKSILSILVWFWTKTFIFVKWRSFLVLIQRLD